MEVLDREGIRATFFMPGYNVRREPRLAAEVASRHAVGNHTFTHPHLTWSRTRKVREELERGQEAIQGATGTLPTIFRVPHGWYGPQVISTAEELGLRCVGWSVMAWDWNRPPSDTIRRRILRGAGPGGITLLHDGQDTDAFPEADRSRTIAAVPHIIRTLKDSGYSFTTVPELMVLDAAHGHP
jgi:peptidoglycan/xylan/chitin deacetylase (PgdA/CDA1 family)